MDSDGEKSRRTLKIFLVGCGGLALLLTAAAIWLGLRLTSEPGEVELTPYHPFRSPAAKARYLQRYDMWAREWPVASEPRTVDTSWGQTFVRISGPLEAPPLVLLPGAGANSLMWIPNIEALSASYRTYAVDNIYDIGRSVYTRPITSSNDFARWLDELFTGLELGNDIRLMGVSYGGWLTSQYALHSPHRLARVVLVAPAGTVLNFDSEFLMRAILAQLPHRFFVKSLLYWLTEDTLRLRQDGQHFVDEAVEDAYVGRQSFEFRQLPNPTILTDEELLHLDVPTLYLVGENEKIYSAAEAVARLQRVAPQIHTEIIPEAGHDLTLAQTELVNERVLAFLRDSAASPDPIQLLN